MGQLTTSAIATAHPEGARAGRLAMERGGNAVDAAAAAMMTLCVVMPQQVGLGGYGGSLIAHLEGEGKRVCIDFDTVGPRGFRGELYPNAQAANHGYLAVSVPGVVAGVAMAVKGHGRLGFGAACEYAAEVAERGVVVDETDRRQIVQWAGRTDAVSRKALFAGELPEVGELWVQKEKAKLLRRLAEEGAEAFYRGEIPRVICRQIREHGGILSEEDFGAYRARYVEPVSVEYRGHTLLTPPPPSGGVTTLQILKVLEQFDLSRVEPFSAEYYHLLAEVIKRCWEDRKATAGDPDFVEMPMGKLLSAEYAARKAEEVRRGGIGAFAPERSGGTHTANVLAADREGNVVSVTATQGYLFGSQVVIEGLGMVMGHGMSRFDFEERSPNGPGVGKRPFHNMSPMIGMRDGRVRFAMGLPGGPKIVTVTAQLVVDLVDFGLKAGEAVRAPRIHVETREPVAVSSGVSEEVVRGLQGMGHEVVRGQSVGGPPTEIAGMANVMVIENGVATAASQAGREAAVEF